MTMMKKTFFLFLALSLIIDAKCDDLNRITKENTDVIIVNENRFERLMELAKSYMDSNPEFAFNCAYKANEIATQTNNIERQAASNIIMGDIFNNNGSPLNAIPYYEKALEGMDALNNYEEMSKMYINLSNIYNNNNLDITKAFTLMHNAVDYANKSNSQYAFINATMSLAELYYTNNDYSSALATYNKVLKTNPSDDNYRFIAKVFTKKAEILIRQKEYEKAVPMIDSSIILCTYNSDINLMVKNYGFMAEIYDSLNILDKTDNYYQKTIKMAYDNKEYEDCGKYMYNYGLHEIRLNNIDKAIDILKILCDSTETFRWFDICYLSCYQLSKCYAEINDYEMAYKLFNKYDIIYDSANKVRQKQMIDKINTGHLLKLNIEELKSKEMDFANKRDNNKTRITSITIICVLSIMLVTFIILYSRHRILFYKNKEALSAQQLRIDKMENELMTMNFKSNKEILVNLTLHFKFYIDYVETLKKDLKVIVDSPESEQKNKIKSFYANIQNNTLLLNGIQGLNGRINDIYKDFLSRLEQQYPDLTKTEKRLCTMLFINMSSKEIAAITNTTIRSVETSRYRLRKKFNLLRDDDMVEFLKKI